MSYILPINQYQYQQYQERVKGVKLNNKRTIGIDRVKRAYLFRSELFKEKDPFVHKTRKQSESVNRVNKVYAQLTGIGGQFDESI